MWLPRTAVAVDHFHLVSLANQALTEARQNLSQLVKGRRGRNIDKAWAYRMLLLRADSLADAVLAREELKTRVQAAGRPETNKLYRTVCRWWNKIEVLIVTGATTGKVEANNIGIKHIKRTARGYRNPGKYKSIILMRSAVRTAA